MSDGIGSSRIAVGEGGIVEEGTRRGLDWSQADRDRQAPEARLL